MIGGVGGVGLLLGLLTGGLLRGGCLLGFGGLALTLGGFGVGAGSGFVSGGLARGLSGSFFGATLAGGFFLGLAALFGLLRGLAFALGLFGSDTLGFGGTFGVFLALTLDVVKVRLVLF